MIDRPKLGDILLRAGVIDELQLKTALGDQMRWGGRLGLSLIKSGFLTERDLMRAVASQLDLPIATLEGKRISQSILELVPATFAHEHNVLPLFVKDEGGIETLYLGTDDPSNLDVLDDLSFRAGMQVRPVLVAPSELCEGIDRFYRGMPTGPRDAPRPALAPDMELASPGEARLDDAHPPSQPQDLARTQPQATTGRPALESYTPRLVLRALTEIVIESGLVDPDALATRVRALKDEEEEF